MRGTTNLMYNFLSFGQQRVAFMISLAKSSPSFWKNSIYKPNKCWISTKESSFYLFFYKYSFLNYFLSEAISA